MSDLLGAAAEIQHFLRQANERFCFIGGLAVQRWGEPRLTRDVDLTLLCPFGAEREAVDRVLRAFAPRMADARDFALRNRVLLVVSGKGVPIDIALGAIDFEERCVARASEFDFGDAQRGSTGNSSSTNWSRWRQCAARPTRCRPCAR